MLQKPEVSAYSSDADRLGRADVKYILAEFVSLIINYMIP